MTDKAQPSSASVGAESSATRLDEMRRIYYQVEDHMTCCHCELCEQFRVLAEEERKMSENKLDPLHPSAALLCKLGSIVVHADELFSPQGHTFDKVALEQLINDPEVQAWLKQMDSMAMLPKKR